MWKAAVVVVSLCGRGVAWTVPGQHHYKEQQNALRRRRCRARRCEVGMGPRVMPEEAVGGHSRNVRWEWRGHETRYTYRGAEGGGAAEERPSVVLLHGLFVNADHWRKTVPHLASRGYNVYALDLLGSGYSSKPAPRDPAAVATSGEAGLETDSITVEGLGTASGGRRGPVEVPLKHPLGSVYNFYTWSEQVVDFVREVVRPTAGVALVCNSIGCVSGLLAARALASDVAGVYLVAPNFRELHAAEQPAIGRPATRAVQAALRETPLGGWLFDALAKPDTVKAILREPYHDPAAVDDELVEALLPPLLEPGASDVVFDALSYSAGPLPEQLLMDFPEHLPVWVATGRNDPWTPLPRVRALERYPNVRRVDELPDCGHCPHDERPDLLNPILDEFLADVFAHHSTDRRENNNTRP